jgi:hypothetical protein
VLPRPFELQPFPLGLEAGHDRHRGPGAVLLGAVRTSCNVAIVLAEPARGIVRETNVLAPPKMAAEKETEIHFFFFFFFF